MSEYWVSKKKYFCRYCDIYIADDAPSRQQHENGLRHKGNVERFIRGLYKGSEKRKKDLDEEKRDMARVESAAQAAYAQDVASGRAKTMAVPLASTSSTPRRPPPKPSNLYANYSTAASLGYSDPDAERFTAEMGRRRTEGVAGDWQVVTASPTTPAETLEPAAGHTLKHGAEFAVDDEDGRQFKLRKKTLNVGLGEIYDPGIIPVALKKKEITPPLEVTGMPSVPTDTRKWTPVQWRRPGEVAKEEDVVGEPLAAKDDLALKAEEEPGVIVEDAPASIGDQVLYSSGKDSYSDIPTAKSEDAEVPTPDASGSMFRKRKSRSNGNKGKA